MLSILNEFTLQKKLQTCRQILCFGQKKVKTIPYEHIDCSQTI